MKKIIQHCLLQKSHKKTFFFLTKPSANKKLFLPCKFLQCKLKVRPVGITEILDIFGNASKGCLFVWVSLTKKIIQHCLWQKSHKKTFFFLTKPLAIEKLFLPCTFLQCKLKVRSVDFMEILYLAENACKSCLFVWVSLMKKIIQHCLRQKSHTKTFSSSPRLRQINNFFYLVSIYSVN